MDPFSPGRLFPPSTPLIWPGLRSVSPLSVLDASAPIVGLLAVPSVPAPPVTAKQSGAQDTSKVRRLQSNVAPKPGCCKWQGEHEHSGPRLTLESHVSPAARPGDGALTHGILLVCSLPLLSAHRLASC